MMKCWCGGSVRLTGEEAECADSSFHDPLATGEKAEIKKLYISGPMSGYPEANYPAFYHAADRLVAAGFEVANPADCVLPGRVHYVDLLKQDIRDLMECDGIATLYGWLYSPGARTEVTVANSLKMPVHPVDHWVSVGPTT